MAGVLSNFIMPDNECFVLHRQTRPSTLTLPRMSHSERPAFRSLFRGISSRPVAYLHRLYTSIAIETIPVRYYYFNMALLSGNALVTGAGTTIVIS